MLKILHAKLQHYANQELPDVQAEFRKGRGTRDQIAKICWTMEKAFDCVDHDELWKTFREMETPDHLTYLLRNLYMGLEATV